MSDTPQSGDGERTNLAPILAPIITLFIGFGAGVVFSEFIPLGQTPTIQATGGPSSGERGERERESGEVTIDPETQQMLEDAAAEGDESAREALEELDPPSDTDVPGDG